MNDDNLMTMMRGSWYCIIMFATLHWRKLRLQQQIGGVSWHEICSPLDFCFQILPGGIKMHQVPLTKEIYTKILRNRLQLWGIKIQKLLQHSAWHLETYGSWGNGNLMAVAGFKRLWENHNLVHWHLRWIERGKIKSRQSEREKKDTEAVCWHHLGQLATKVH